APLPRSGIGTGTLQSFLKPLLIDDTTKRPVETPCGATGTSSCLAWDAAERLYAQAPTKTEVNAATPDLHLGLAANQLLVYYSTSGSTAIPMPRKLFQP